jgi:hypothetical protein
VQKPSIAEPIRKPHITSLKVEKELEEVTLFIRDNPSHPILAGIRLQDLLSFYSRFECLFLLPL